MPIRKKEHTACQVCSLASKARSPGLLPARSRGILRIRRLSAILIFATVAIHLVSNRIHLLRVFGGIRRVVIVVCGRLGAVLGFHVHFVMYSPATGGGKETQYHAFEDTWGVLQIVVKASEAF
jgi:hypothetical protein